ncbi:alpha,alpha-trehalose-phosphate synthase (UDP-forming) [Tersicoccus sp. MR15.9]|uniref:alpha,alpha-trehalose-phosphate synthase (UDP-forming) n=1 Tax=Tersicoccus mangrovi TaxID=3121635 RepID=UPI002FE5D541
MADTAVSLDPGPGPTPPGDYDFIVVSNRLPVDRVTIDGQSDWRRSPGGLVTALAPVMEHADGAWVGWNGASDEPLDEFDHSGMHLVPVDLSAREVELYYEGFANATLWPLYHDVIAPPEFHRTWWDAYRRVNRRFAEASANAAAEGATVWVQDYQLQLVPAMLRQLRPDLRIGFFNHIPFPPLEIYAQLPWRQQVLEGLAGADLIGFQRPGDAQNFTRCVRRFLGAQSRQGIFTITDEDGAERQVEARAFPISIDSRHIADLAADPAVVERARQIRHELGDPTTLLLGVDRLDYTKGIPERLKAFGELLEDHRVSVEDCTLVQVASPSRERVEHYKTLRDDVESTVGRINGTYDTLEKTAIRYLHQSYPVEEMVALYLAADVLLVTALRDGMNLVAKEYVAARTRNNGVLVLSEFTGAAEQLRQALLVNTHDIDGVKNAIVRAIHMEPREAARRMRAMRKQVLEHDVKRWSTDFLSALQESR